MDMPKVAIVAALEREVRPLVRSWRVSEEDYSGRRFRFFENDKAILVCGGIGAEAARRAAEAIISMHSPAMIYSAGFAGALEPSLKVGDILEPRRVINAGDGSAMDLESGKGVLVSFSSIADVAQKSKLQAAFSAQAVDMEAAAVARAAEARGVKFAVVKVISDESNFSFPDMQRFIAPTGQFSEARFAFFAATRPWLWPQVARLARNSNRASRLLCTWLEANVGKNLIQNKAGTSALADAPAGTKVLDTVPHQ